MVEQDTPEKLFAQNMKLMREHIGWSQNELAKRMSNQGFRWYAATVYSVEKGERKIPLNEAAAIAGLMQADLHVMTRPTPEVALRMDADSHWENFRRAAQALLNSAEVYEGTRKALLHWAETFKVQYVSRGQTNLYARLTKYGAYELISPSMDQDDKRVIQKLRSSRETARLFGEGDSDEYPEET